jgi:hypothetical protein
MVIHIIQNVAIAPINNRIVINLLELSLRISQISGFCELIKKFDSIEVFAKL